jgi:hypothetical protein
MYVVGVSIQFLSGRYQLVDKIVARNRHTLSFGRSADLNTFRNVNYLTYMEAL